MVRPASKTALSISGPNKGETKICNMGKQDVGRRGWKVYFGGEMNLSLVTDE
jgi:hypothetical protein